MIRWFCITHRFVMVTIMTVSCGGRLGLAQTSPLETAISKDVYLCPSYYDERGVDPGTPAALDLKRSQQMANGSPSRGLIGAAVGAGAGLGLAFAVCTNRQTCNSGLLLGAAALGAIIGLGVASVFSEEIPGGPVARRAPSRFPVPCGLDPG